MLSCPMSTEPIVVRIVRRLDASPQRVFDAWFDPQLLGRWMFGPSIRNEEIAKVSFDPRVGGTFSFVIRRQGNEIDYLGTYHEIDRPKRLVISWRAVGSDTTDGTVSIDIAACEGGCELTLHHTMFPQGDDHASRVESIWQARLTALSAALR
jgi:uncharacterized protein YndB with AHSA1/START domain